MKSNKVLKNTIMQYLMTFAQHIFPLLTFPYLTRVLEPEGYAVVTYMTSFVVYFQYFIDYGFTLSSTKQIAENQANTATIEKVWGATTQAKLILAFIAVILFSCIVPFVTLLRENAIIGYLYLCAPILSIFLPDYLFRGLEDMGIITTRFVLTRTISTALTFVLVKGKRDIVFIPILNIFSFIVSIVLTQIQIKRKYHFKLHCVRLHEVIANIRNAGTYFISTAATTAFGAFNAFMLGVMPISATEIGYWGAFYGLIASAQGLYTPIINSIYPHMVKKRDFRMIKRLLIIFMPMIIIVTTLTAIFAEKIIYIFCGIKYVDGAMIFRLLIPILILSFPTLVLNFPVLGATGHVKKTAILTMIGASFHIVGLLVLAVSGYFTVENVAILRSITEGVLLSLILFYVYKETSFFRKAED